jgi:hypothetical protein
MPSDIVKAIIMPSYNAASLDGTYKVLTTSLEQACFLISFINNSDVPVTISYDGTNAHDYVRANSTRDLNFQTNSRPGNNKALLKKGSPVYIKGTVGTGYIFLVGYYQL